MNKSSTNIALIVFLLLVACSSALFAQQQKPMYLETPYDMLHVKNGNAYKAYTIDLPERYNIRIPTRGSLKLQLVNPDDANAEPGEVLIPWVKVDRIEVFESLVLAEANKLTREGKFDEAFGYFVHLEQVYPDTPNLDRSIQAYLYSSALDLAKQSRLPEALSALEELFARNPQYANAPGQTVAAAISGVTNQMLGAYTQRDDISSTRRMLSRLTRSYGKTQITSVPRWTSELNRRAAIQRDKAQELLDAGDNRAAYLVTVEMLRIWPAVAGGKEVALEAARRYPIARVAVTERTKDLTPRQIDNWAGRRLSRLQNRLLVEYVEPGPSGGIYKSAFGKLEQNDDLTAVYFDLRKPQQEDELSLTAFDLASILLERAAPESDTYSESWASLLSGVAVRNPYELTIQFRRSNVLPEAYLQIPLKMEGELSALTKGGYNLRQEDEVESQWVLDTEYAFRGSTQPAEIVETVYEHTSDAVTDLINGKVDVIDRLHPPDAAKLLREAPLDVRVGRYAEPTVHVLIPKLDHPFMARDAFRRALAYAIPREKILNALVLEGESLEGAQVLDAPFSKDSYGYDETIPPMQFDARLGKLLTLMAGNELQQIAEKKEEEPPAFEPLVIGHPATKMGRTVTAAIEAQLKSLGIACSRKEFPPGEVRDASGECDLVFAEVQIPEPIVDAERLLSSIGLAESPSPYVGMGIQRLNRAQDWKEVAARLKDLHRISIQNMALIPLWQFPEHFAHREGVHGISDNILTLYQDIEQWQVEPLLLEDAE